MNMCVCVKSHLMLRPGFAVEWVICSIRRYNQRTEMLKATTVSSDFMKLTLAFSSIYSRCCFDSINFARAPATECNERHRVGGEKLIETTIQRNNLSQIQNRGQFFFGRVLCLSLSLSRFHFIELTWSTLDQWQRHFSYFVSWHFGIGIGIGCCSCQK